ncbi:class I SAM-dependent DNA methyltransferase [Pseudotamlana agarivorans]|uniref:class I SAM-dependent DNA methyltransferase n=1 Tax=Pseudotamlana agarivorans TaxID=481183 RepID=UPI00082D70FC|nr:class I SAM-dependent methyltransferase [Tamlana agarivorans]
MNANNETFATWDKIAQLYEAKFMKEELYNASYDYFCALLANSKAKIMDVACGPGNITQYLLKKHPTCEILGVDIAPNMIALAEKNNPTAKFKTMDIRLIGEFTDKYHGIICGFCVPYLSEDECHALISNASTLLHNEGVLYLSFVEGDPKDSKYKSGNAGRVFFYYHRLQTIKTQLLDNGFSVLETINLPFKTSDTTSETHTILVAKKL